MKKNKRTKLVVGREVLRILRERDQRLAQGGGALPITLFDCPPPPLTGDSRMVCCA